MTASLRSGVVIRRTDAQSCPSINIRKITQKTVMNIVEQCISIITLDILSVATYIFEKYPLFFEKLFKYNRNSERSGCDLK